MFKEITKDNWLLYAQQNYDNPIVNKEVELIADILEEHDSTSHVSNQARSRIS